MAFDFGFDFRATAGFVTDPNFCAPELGELYPHTYTNALGTSITAGAIDPSAVQNTRDRNASNDPRLAGQDGNNGNTFTPSFFQFKVALPFSGQWSVVLASGDQAFASSEYISILDNTTVIASYSAVSVATNNYMDASGNVWPQASFFASQVPIVYTFASSILIVQVGPSSPTGSSGSNLAHLRITSGQATDESGGAPSLQLVYNLWPRSTVQIFS
jgi:hypothetical protein